MDGSMGAYDKIGDYVLLGQNSLTAPIAIGILESAAGSALQAQVATGRVVLPCDSGCMKRYAV
jgi:bifunctional N-acetylglucosamine-1-phosphate-uridyltransferase/glucosamine-1-phosphate-acetyltransferase GlmU-like protein